MTQNLPSATLNDIVTAAAATYADKTAPIMGPQWKNITAIITANPVLSKAMSDSGFSGQAYIDGQTGELIIGSRGTVGNTYNIISDIKIALTASNDAQSVADSFAKAALAAATTQLKLLGVNISAIYTTGHSLGGSESQGQAAMLSTATDQDGNPLLPTGVKITNVSIDAPGISGLSTIGNSNNYTSYNFSSQGDLIHLSGGSNLAGTTSVSLAIGPSMWETAGLLGVGTALQSILGVGSLFGGAIIADSLSNALDAHSSVAFANSLAVTALGQGAMSQLNKYSPAQMQKMFGVAVSPTLVYDTAGYDQNGYTKSGYSIYGTDHNGKIDPSISVKGGQTNIDFLSDGSKITVVIAKDGSATEVLSASDGMVYTYIRNASGSPIGIITQSQDGTILKQTIDPITGEITQSETSGGLLIESGTVQKNSDGSVSAVTSTFNNANQTISSEVDQKYSNGTSKETDVNYSNNTAQGQVVINSNAADQIVSANISGQGDNAYINNASITLAAGASATLIGSGNIITEALGSSLSVSGADTFKTIAGTIATAGNTQITTSADGKTFTAVEDVNNDGKTDLQEKISIDATGAITTDIKDFTLTTALKDETTTVLQTNGSKTVSMDTDGNGKIDESDKFSSTGMKSSEALFNAAGMQTDAETFNTAGLISQDVKLSNNMPVDILSYTNGIKTEDISFNSAGMRTLDSLYNPAGAQTDAKTFDTTGQVNQDRQFSNGVLQDALNYTNGVKTNETFYNAASQTVMSDTYQRTGMSSYSETDVNYSNNLAQGQIVLNSNANGQVISAAVSGIGATANLNNATITFAAGTSATVIGNGNIVNSGTNSTVSLVGNDTVNGSGGKVNLAANNTDTINGISTINSSANDVIVTNGAAINVGGNLLAGQSVGTTTVIGSGNIVSAGTGNTIIATGNDTFSGLSDRISLSNNNTAIITGLGMVLNTAANDVIVGNNAAVNVGGNLAAGQSAGMTTLVGNGNIVSAGAANMVSLQGNDTVNGTGDKVYLSANNIVTTNGAGMVINTNVGDTVIGNGATVNVGGNLATGYITGMTTLIGVGDIVSGGTGSNITLTGSATINGLADNVFLAANTTVSTSGWGMLVSTNANDTMYGNGATIVIGRNLAAGLSTGVTTISGNADLVYDSAPNTMLIGNNCSGVKIYGTAGDSIKVGAGDSIDVHGNNITETEGAASKVLDYGTGDTDNGVKVVSGQEATTNANDATSIMNISSDASQFDEPASSSNTSTSTATSTTSASSASSNNTSSGSSDDDLACDDDDPIILNLQGSKVQTTALSGSSTYFDMQNTGQRVQTAWVTAGEGILVYDPTNTGAVMQDASLVAGFDALSTLAKTSSGTLDASNPLWKQLKVWVDQNGDATCQQGELMTLDQFGIASINLKSTAEHVDSNGNTILNDSTFTWNNGAKGDIAGVNLGFKSGLAAIPASTSSAAVVSSVNQLLQSMAGLTDGNAGIDLKFLPSSANANTFLLAASSARQA